MSADQLVTYLTWGIFALLFVLVLRNAVRAPQPVNIRIVLLFGAPALIIAIGVASLVGLVESGPILNAINSALLLAIAYVMLLLVDDFASAPRWLLWAGSGLYAALAVGGFVFAPPRPAWFTALQFLFFVGLQFYAAAAFVRMARRSSGVTRRRAHAIALGSLLLGLAIVAAVLQAQAAWWRQVFTLCALGAGVSYFLGFAPPLRLRRSWQEPELRGFLAESNRLSHMWPEDQVVRALEDGVARALGAPSVRIGLWDAGRGALDFSRDDMTYYVAPNEHSVSGRAFLAQRPRYHTYQRAPATYHEAAPWPRAVIAAPITAGDERLGVLAVYATHTPLVAVEDLDLVQLLADQVAAVLEMRRLIDALAQTQARAEAARLKDDFLSAAAHDLKTPLTTVLGQAQRLERRMRRDEHAQAYLPGIELVVRESQRLRRGVLELLDAARGQRGQILGAREPVDLVALAREVTARYDSPRHRCIVEGDSGVVGEYDRERIAQLLANLLDNAVLYSPGGGTIRVSVRRSGAEVELAVADQGIGIADEDLPQLFDRFFRGSNVDDRRYAGMGLSLYICRAIAEQHGGRIRATSALGRGSTFYVTLPLQRERAYATA